ncbi:MAG: hypothetical protein ABIY51_13255 [Ferruginibacter sp.]
MISILVGTFMVSMVGLLIWTYRKQSLLAGNDQTSEENSDYATNDATVKNKLFTVLSDTEKRISESISDIANRKKQSKGINLEPGTLL